MLQTMPIITSQPNEPGERDEEPQAGPEVGGQDHVDAAHQHRHRDDDDEDAAQLGLPPDGEQGRKVACMVTGSARTR